MKKSNSEPSLDAGPSVAVFSQKPSTTLCNGHVTIQDESVAVPYQPHLLLTVRQTATYLQIGVNRCYELINREDNPIPSIKFDTTIRVPRDALERWVRENTRG